MDYIGKVCDRCGSDLVIGFSEPANKYACRDCSKFIGRYEWKPVLSYGVIFLGYQNGLYSAVNAPLEPDKAIWLGENLIALARTAKNIATLPEKLQGAITVYAFLGHWNTEEKALDNCVEATEEFLNFLNVYHIPGGGVTLHIKSFRKPHPLVGGVRNDTFQNSPKYFSRK